MSKNKFFKKLLIAGLCVVSATAVIGGVAACKKNDDDETQKEQTLEYTVSYDLDGGEWGTATHTDKVTAGGKLTKPGNPTKTGKVFDKWILVSTQADYDFESAVNANLALKAVWKDPVASYTVTLDLDGGTWTGAQATYTATAGQKLSDVLGTLLDSEPTKTGHEFLGLLIGTEDADSDTVISANVTVKVNWKLLHQHTWAETPTEIDANWHGIHATCNEPGEGCATAIKEGSKEAHVDANHDGKCDTCGYDDSASLTAKFTELVGKQGLVYANTFTESKKLDKFSAWGTAGVYGLPAATGIDDTHYVDVVDGVAKQVTNGTNLGTVVDFGGVKELGVLEGHFNFSVNANGSSWRLIQFYNNQEPTDDNLVFALYTPAKDGKLKYATSKADAGQALKNEFTIVVGTNYSLYYKFDLNAGTVTMTITSGNTSTTILEDADIGVSALTGMRAVSGNGGARCVTLDNVAVVYTAPDAASVKAANDAKVAAIAANIPTAEDVSDQDDATKALAAAGDAAKSAYDTAVAVDGITVPQLQAAYATYETAIKTAMVAYSDTYFAAGGVYASTNYTNEGDGGNKAAYEEVIAEYNAVKADIANKTVDDLWELFESLGPKFEGNPDEGVEPQIKPDSWYSASDVASTIKVKYGDGVDAECGLVIATTGIKKPGDFLHKSDIDAAISAVASDKIISNYYADSSKTQEATFWEVEENLIVYVELAAATSDKGTYTYTVNKGGTEGNYTYTTVKEKSDGSLGDPAAILITETSTAKDSADFKFSSNDDHLVFKVKVTAGQTVTVKISGKGASDKDNGITSATSGVAATVSAGSETIASQNGKVAFENKLVTYTVSAAGELTITLSRISGAGVKVNTVVVTVADPA